MKNTILKTLVLVAIAAVVLYSFDAFAADAKQFWTSSFNAMVRTFKNVRVIVYVIGAFGLIGIAIGGIMGKINWKWLGYLAIGLAIVAMADMVITFATKGMKDSSQSADISLDQWQDN